MDSSPPPPPPPPSQLDLLGGVIHTSNHVLAAHTRHFLALTVLFLLPFSSLLLFFPCPLRSLSPHSLLRSSLSLSPSPLILSLFALLLLFLYLSAFTSIAHSVQDGFFGRSVKILSTLLSLPLPFSRLFLTFLSAILTISALLTLLSSLLFLSLHFLSIPHLPVYLFFGLILSLSLIYLLTSWILAGPVTILEPICGFNPLYRSSHLIKGMYLSSLSLFLFFSIGIGLIIWGFNIGKIEWVARDWRELVSPVARMVFGSGIIAILLLYWCVVSVVLYMYCKALNGELAGEIAEEFASDYVCLPFDDRKVPHIVCVVRE